VPDYKSYWNENISKWGDLYLDASHGHEVFDRPAWFSSLYQKSIGRIERRLMRSRYERTCNFLRSYVMPGDTVSDIGCGTGIFLQEALRCEAGHVHAIDFSESALQVARAHINSAKVSYHLMDVQTGRIPDSDVAIAMGLTPYITDLPAFLRNAIRSAKVLQCLYVDPKHPANRVRSAIPMVNVRNLQMYSPETVDSIYADVGGQLIDRRKFATGFIDIVIGLRGSLSSVPIGSSDFGLK